MITEVQGGLEWISAPFVMPAFYSEMIGPGVISLDEYVKIQDLPLSLLSLCG